MSKQFIFGAVILVILLALGVVFFTKQAANDQDGGFIGQTVEENGDVRGEQLEETGGPESLPAQTMLPDDGNANSRNQQDEQGQIVLFYGEGCPACAQVNAYLQENNVQSQVSFSHKEVYYNQDNTNELIARAGQCGIGSNSIGVPFLWDGERCLMGSPDIISFFAEKIK